jgi:hypothetical protein
MFLLVPAMKHYVLPPPAAPTWVLIATIIMLLCALGFVPLGVDIWIRAVPLIVKWKTRRRGPAGFDFFVQSTRVSDHLCRSRQACESLRAILNDEEFEGLRCAVLVLEIRKFAANLVRPFHGIGQEGRGARCRCWQHAGSKWR